MKILVTGTAGFIGFHLTKSLVERGDEVIGLDNINDYYDVNLKFSRLNEIGIEEKDINWNEKTQSTKYQNLSFYRVDLADRDAVVKVFEKEKFEKVCHLAAQPGVRYSLVNPHAYVQSNIVGFLNILEGCRNHKVKHLAYASSSSVYGLNETMPLSEKHNVDHPISLYASTKKSNELMAHTYSHLFDIPTTGLRFFTVYGSWGRPDMAMFLFTDAIVNSRPINIFNNGNLSRDFTHVSDIVAGISLVVDNPPKGDAEWSGKNPNPSRSKAPYRVYNIGNNDPVKLMDYIETIEKSLDIEATKNFMPMQPGDMTKTYADVQDLMTELNYQPQMNIQKGVKEFVDWYKSYYLK